MKRGIATLLGVVLVALLVGGTAAADEHGAVGGASATSGGAESATGAGVGGDFAVGGSGVGGNLGSGGSGVGGDFGVGGSGVGGNLGRSLLHIGPVGRIGPIGPVGELSDHEGVRVVFGPYAQVSLAEKILVVEEQLLEAGAGDADEPEFGPL